jgi:glucose-1-phosphate cytidylyltransferase
MTGGRVKRIQKYVGNEPFMLTYGDGVGDVNIAELVKFHQNHGKIATLTTVNVGQRFGVIDMGEDNFVQSFREKQDIDSSVVNGGFMVFQPEIFNYIEGDNTTFEKEPLETVANMHQLKAYKHNGFWHCMDTQRDKQNLEALWAANKAPWKVWEN